MADILAHRVVDWYRSQADGHGDRRLGFDNRIVLAPSDDEAFAVDGEDEFEALLSERRAAEWQWAANAVDLSLAEWVVQTLDQAARVMRRASVTT